MTVDLTCRSCDGSGQETGNTPAFHTAGRSIGAGRGKGMVVECPTCRGAGALDRERVALDVARAHGTRVAHEVTGVPKYTIVRLRKQRDGYDRGRGRPTRAEMAAEAPRLDCGCVLCIDHRTELGFALDWAANSRTGLVAGLDLPWKADAACRDEDPDLFFPERGESLAAPKAVCSRCPVREACLECALDTGQKFGVWGGTSERDRRRLRRQRRKGSEAA
jgi:WhiB family redox-sensing transcriptional regulator